MKNKINEITKRMLAESEEANAVVSKHVMDEIDKREEWLNRILKQYSDELKRITDEIFQRLRNEL